MRMILHCVTCGSYTFQKDHCGVRAENPRPAKFSPDDKYAKYRRKAREELKK